MMIEEALDALHEFAQDRGLDLVVWNGTPQEPEHVVSLRIIGSNGPAVISRTSQDSADTAAFYLVNALGWLGVDLAQKREGAS